MSRDRLSSVLRIRTIQERSARGELAMQRIHHRQAETAEWTTWTMLDGRAMPTASFLPALVVLGQRALVSASMGAAAVQHDATASALQQVHAAMDVWTIATRRVEGLERLADRLDSAENQESVRRAANEIDDRVLATFCNEAPR